MIVNVFVRLVIQVILATLLSLVLVVSMDNSALMEVNRWEKLDRVVVGAHLDSKDSIARLNSHAW